MDIQVVDMDAKSISQSCYVYYNHFIIIKLSLLPLIKQWLSAIIMSNFVGPPAFYQSLLKQEAQIGQCGLQAPILWPLLRDFRVQMAKSWVYLMLIP